MRHYPRHYRFGFLRRRRCVCGLPWPCCDAWRPETSPIPDGETHVRPSAPEWTGPTALLAQVGRAGMLTPAQAERAAGGR